jgi:hypothetical protein
MGRCRHGLSPAASGEVGPLTNEFVCIHPVEKIMSCMATVSAPPPYWILLGITKTAGTAVRPLGRNAHGGFVPIRSCRLMLGWLRKCEITTKQITVTEDQTMRANRKYYVDGKDQLQLPDKTTLGFFNVSEEGIDDFYVGYICVLRNASGVPTYSVRLRVCQDEVATTNTLDEAMPPLLRTTRKVRHGGTVKQPSLFRLPFFG